ncbi:hypothetical protein C8Q75DRAFT_740333 [Abortiporus biennis]|nr:hypothetical protein C8Q75DRAFT_740333 [Abortiporus biennis]
MNMKEETICKPPAIQKYPRLAYLGDHRPSLQSYMQLNEDARGFQRTCSYMRKIARKYLDIKKPLETQNAVSLERFIEECSKHPTLKKYKGGWPAEIYIRVYLKYHSRYRGGECGRPQEAAMHSTKTNKKVPQTHSELVAVPPRNKLANTQPFKKNNINNATVDLQPSLATTCTSTAVQSCTQSSHNKSNESSDDVEYLRGLLKSINQESLLPILMHAGLKTKSDLLGLRFNRTAREDFVAMLRQTGQLTVLQASFLKGLFANSG